MAVASGMVRGLGLGANSVSALITRGLAELSRLALAQAAHGDAMGLAGLRSRLDLYRRSIAQRYVGQELGRGRRLDEGSLRCAKWQRG